MSKNTHWRTSKAPWIFMGLVLSLLYPLVPKKTYLMLSIQVLSTFIHLPVTYLLPVSKCSRDKNNYIFLSQLDGVWAWRDTHFSYVALTLVPSSLLLVRSLLLQNVSFFCCLESVQWKQNASCIFAERAALVSTVASEHTGKLLMLQPLWLWEYCSVSCFLSGTHSCWLGVCGFFWIQIYPPPAFLPNTRFIFEMYSQMV